MRLIVHIFARPLFCFGIEREGEGEGGGKKREVGGREEGRKGRERKRRGMVVAQFR